MENIKNVRLQTICKTCPPIISPCMDGKKNVYVQSIFFFSFFLEHIFSLIVFMGSVLNYVASLSCFEQEHCLPFCSATSMFIFILYKT